MAVAVAVKKEERTAKAQSKIEELRTGRKLLGQNDIRTMLIYAHVLNRGS